MMNKIIKYNYILFYWLSLAIILFFVLEIIFPGLVLAYFNVNILVFLWLINLLVFIFKKKN